MESIIFNLNLPKIMWIIKRKLLIIIAITAIGAAGAGAYGYINSYTTYMSKVSFYVVSNPSYLSETSVNVSSSEFIMATNLVPSYMLVLKSDTVMNKIIENLSINATANQLRNMISSSTVEDTAVFYVYVVCADPYESMNIANSIADVAPSEISRVVKSGGVEVIDYATLPTEPYNSTNVFKYIIIGGAGGFILPLILFLIIGLLDTTIRNKDEIERVFTIPVISEVPVVPSTRRNRVKKVLNPESMFVYKEAYNDVRTNLMFMSSNKESPRYIFSSDEKGDGKTLNCINTAISFAQINKKVLIIDADLRNPSVMNTLQLKKGKSGLSDFLAGMVKEVVITKTDIESLDVIDAGTIPPNPAELLASDKLSKLLNDMSFKYDYIFIDTSPLGIVSDALLLASYSTGYVLVMRAESTKMKDEKKVVKMLEQVDANISGFIYNAVNYKSKQYGKKKYEYGQAY